MDSSSRHTQTTQEHTAHRSRAFKDQAARQFESWSHSYDRSLLNYMLFNPSYLVLLEEVRRWQETYKRHCTILDVGCGTGTFASYLQQSNLDVTIVGMDFVAEMCIKAQYKDQIRAQHKAQHQSKAHQPAQPIPSRSSFVTGDSEHLPFSNSAFDIVTCSNSFHHYPHQQAVIHDMHRVLKPEGRLILIDGFRDNIIGWFVFDIIVAGIEKHVHHASWSLIENYFKSAGFQNIHRRKFNTLAPAVATIGSAAIDNHTADSSRTGANG